MTRLKGAEKVVGTRRLTRAIEENRVRIAYIALDADLFITRKITELCRQKDVPLVEAPTMKALGEACGIEVPAASAGLLK